MSAPETEVVAQKKSKTFEMRKSSYNFILVVLILTVISTIVAGASRYAESSACESFWKESCTQVYVPESVQSNFSKDYYDSIKH